MKIVINRCFGGFGLSTKAFERLIELGMTITTFENGMIKDKTADIVQHIGKMFGDYSFVKYDSDMRTNPLVIQVVEELKEKANGQCAELTIVEIPDNIEYEIDDYDGMEKVSETHRTWS